MQAPPEQMHFSQSFPLLQTLPLETWIGYFPPPYW
jgi:hypothetical protein